MYKFSDVRISYYYSYVQRSTIEAPGVAIKCNFSGRRSDGLLEKFSEPVGETPALHSGKICYYLLFTPSAT